MHAFVAMNMQSGRASASDRMESTVATAFSNRLSPQPVFPHLGCAMRDVRHYDFRSGFLEARGENRPHRPDSDCSDCQLFSRHHVPRILGEGGLILPPVG
jgi:hypothetical protein